MPTHPARVSSGGGVPGVTAQVRTVASSSAAPPSDIVELEDGESVLEIAASLGASRCPGGIRIEPKSKCCSRAGAVVVLPPAPPALVVGARCITRQCGRRRSRMTRDSMHQSERNTFSTILAQYLVVGWRLETSRSKRSTRVIGDNSRQFSGRTRGHAALLFMNPAFRSSDKPGGTIAAPGFADPFRRERHFIYFYISIYDFRCAKKCIKLVFMDLHILDRLAS